MNNTQILDSIREKADKLKPLVAGSPVDDELQEIEEQLGEILDSYV